MQPSMGYTLGERNAWMEQIRITMCDMYMITPFFQTAFFFLYMNIRTGGGVATLASKFQKSHSTPHK